MSDIMTDRRPIATIGCGHHTYYTVGENGVTSIGQYWEPSKDRGAGGICFEVYKGEFLYARVVSKLLDIIYQEDQ